jgi:hypothetical protein
MIIMISVMKQSKSGLEAGRTRDPSNDAVSEAFQTVSDLFLEGPQSFRNLRY